MNRWRKRDEYLYERNLGPVQLRIIRPNGHPAWAWEVRAPMRSSGILLSRSATFDDLIADPREAKRVAEQKAREVFGPLVAALFTSAPPPP